jgi:hypothetical protein
VAAFPPDFSRADRKNLYLSRIFFVTEGEKRTGWEIQQWQALPGIGHILARIFRW